MLNEPVILVLFIIASGVAVITKRFHLPYTVILVIIGLILGFVNIITPPLLTKELLYSLFLPALIFEAAIHLRAKDLFRELWIIIILVVFGVIFSTLITAGVLKFMSEEIIHASIAWSVAILFGAAVAATDPVSIVPLFKQMGVPRRLRILVESESLLNDGTAIVVFVIVMEFIHRQVSNPTEIGLMFFEVVGLGILIGLIIGVTIAYLIQFIDDPMVVITLTTVGAYLSFLIADYLNASGVMSTVAAGLVIGNQLLQIKLFPSVRLSTETFWEYIVFAFNSLIFLLMGFSINLETLVKVWPIVIIAYISMMLARFIITHFTWALFSKTYLSFPYKWNVVLGWGGIRGALSMVLALSIPNSFEYKDLIVALVFGVVLLTILVQGLTMAPLLKSLKIGGISEKIKTYEKLKAQIKILEDTILKLQDLYNRRFIKKEIADELINEFQSMLEEAKQRIENIQIEEEDLKKAEMLKLKREVLLEQKSKLLEMYHNGIISFEVYEELSKDIDAKLLEIESES